jgi:leucyl/phenylalanyl-tRNA---protein transferase
VKWLKLGSINPQSIRIEQVLAAYRHGYYPMAHGPQGTIGLYASDPRALVPLDDRFIIRKSLRQVLAKHQFEIRHDTAFEEVIRACARHEQDPEEVWLSEEMVGMYVRLFDMGIAHTVECWRENELVGGLYGLVFGSAFCGESMFSRAPYASQVALVSLVDHLRKRGFTLLDAQMPSEHLRQFGLYDVSHKEYLKLFDTALTQTVEF